MAEPIRIANCSGFYGDRLSAAAEMVNDGPIDVLTGDWLAELTMLILARTRQKRPGGGYARSFVKQMEQVMGACLDAGIKVVSNAGGLDPRGCAGAVAEVADRLGLTPRIAFVDGDDLMSRLDPGAAGALTLRSFATGEPMTDTTGLITANAYLGGWGIAEALRRGADIVVTGRVTDAAVACGPAAWHHGWAIDDWDALAGAVAAGHVIECGTQATGGNYSFFTEVEGMARTGFPWAEIAADGSSVIGKHAGTGGAVTVGTVTAQLLYEIDAPGYLGPDVTTRFDTIRLTQSGEDRVLMDSVRGEPPPPTLKVATNEMGGYRSEINVGLTGLDIEAKAALVHEAFWRACPHDRGDYAKVTEQLVRTDKIDPATNEEATAVWRLRVFDRDEERLGRTLSDAMNELALATIPGMFSPGSAARPRAFGIYRPATVPRIGGSQYVTFLDGERTVVDPGAAAAGPVTPDPLPRSARRRPRLGSYRAFAAGPGGGRPLRGQGRQRQPRGVHPLRGRVRLARRVPEHRAAPCPAPRSRPAAGRPASAPQHLVAQLRHSRSARRRRGRLGPSGPAGQEPGRMAAGSGCGCSRGLARRLSAPGARESAAGFGAPTPTMMYLPRKLSSWEGTRQL